MLLVQIDLVATKAKQFFLGKRKMICNHEDRLRSLREASEYYPVLIIFDKPLLDGSSRFARTILAGTLHLDTLPNVFLLVNSLKDSADLKSFSPQGECGLKSRPGHHLACPGTKVLRMFVRMLVLLFRFQIPFRALAGIFHVARIGDVVTPQHARGLVALRSASRPSRGRRPESYCEPLCGADHGAAEQVLRLGCRRAPSPL